jgi:hypothetical protein
MVFVAAKKLPRKYGRQSGQLRTAEKDERARCGWGGLNQPSRRYINAIALPRKSLYVCTATAGEDCQDTELSLDEKPWLIVNLFQYVKVHKSQYLSGTQNAQIIAGLSG